MKTLRLRISALSLAFAIGATAIFSSCESVKNMSNTAKGAGIGTAAGAGIGALIGSKAGNTAVGAIIGGALGGTAGALIGKKMDKQAKEIEAAIPGAEVIPAGEGIIVKFDSGLLFDFNKATLSATAKQNIDNLAASLNKYPDTDILVVGHTDAIGTDAVNNKLSLERANSVVSYAISKGVSSGRLKSSGKGKTEPIASNDTDAGRAQNRRVEIVIVANEAMKAQAKAQAN
ncbi:OmpA/MotB domain protein [Pseudopedobacter saltans DSM 12145]|uniref:OmpA/MotB domain protein n=1 Tax=Pseudopedobacter saltans (strain ATCC 51119 / DSM 12145 / JCM 21818 / CCUG 39354 / LMG 10337 / NBRC 100064 / NCIMB 13643) TaxID=762903 RepID=F0S8W6_PSESL|nr:OmpA family protein [Pseudopedobacter saltans]ADY53453.1 OmpA/MotB domain protein [Pseudopedobacter saltans DSM 12145]